mgnify:CR=1 FL=1
MLAIPIYLTLILLFKQYFAVRIKIIEKSHSHSASLHWLLTWTSNGLYCFDHGFSLRIVFSTLTKQYIMDSVHAIIKVNSSSLQRLKSPCKDRNLLSARLFIHFDLLGLMSFRTCLTLASSALSLIILSVSQSSLLWQIPACSAYLPTLNQWLLPRLWLTLLRLMSMYLSLHQIYQRCLRQPCSQFILSPYAVAIVLALFLLFQLLLLWKNGRRSLIMRQLLLLLQLLPPP